MNPIPNVRIVVGACLIAIVGYAIFSGWVVFLSNDAAQRGDVIGTWKSFAVAAFAFWLGSSSGGKRAESTGPATPLTPPAASGQAGTGNADA